MTALPFATKKIEVEQEEEGRVSKTVGVTPRSEVGGSAV